MIHSPKFDVFFVTLALERPIWRELRFRLRYRYETNDSNVRVFDFDRHRVGAFLVYDFGNP